MKKAFGQTVRDLKRGVNKKVLKVPGIEQKVLDATSNESWGPHGSLLAEIAHASRNYHEYQLTMGVLWKRLTDTGKNWRHVFKALVVLEYMVGYGSERVIDEIKERAHQISTLADFQYVDSSGKDQGSNVRKKAQSLVALVNDKERIMEFREKAAATRDKYRNSVGGMQKSPGGYGDKYDYESRYGDRDDGRSSYGGDRDDDRNSRDGSEDRYGRDGNRDDEHRGRSRSVDNYENESRGRSSERERNFEDDGQSSSRGSGARADDYSQDRVGLHRRYSEQNIGGSPPSYEEVMSGSRSPAYSERETPQAAAPEAAPPPPAERSSVDNQAAGFVNELPPQQVDSFDEFDPRGSVSAGASAPVPSPPTVVPTSAPPASNNSEMDLLGSLSDVFSPNPLAIVTSDSTSFEANGQANTGPAPSFSTSQSSTQHFDDPFGDSPFKAITSVDTDPSNNQSFGAPFQPTPPTSNPDNGHNLGFGEAFSAVPNPESGAHNMQAPQDSSYFPEEQFDTSESDIDILAGILPPSGPPASQSPQPDTALSSSQFPPNGNMYESFHSQAPPTDPNIPGQTPFGQASQQHNMPEQTPFGQSSQHHNKPGQSPFGQASQQHNMPGQAPFGQASQQHNMPGQTPFGQASQHHNMPGQAPFGQDSQQHNMPGQTPFGQASQRPNMPGQTPFGQASQHQNMPGQTPFGQASQQHNMPGQSPFGQASQQHNMPGQSPFGQASQQHNMPGQSPFVQASQQRNMPGQSPFGQAPQQHNIPGQSPYGQASQQHSMPGQSQYGQASQQINMPGQSSQQHNMPGQSPFGQASQQHSMPGQTPSSQAPQQHNVPGQTLSGQAPQQRNMPGQSPFGQASQQHSMPGQTPSSQAPQQHNMPGQSPYGQAPQQRNMPGQTPSGQEHNMQGQTQQNNMVSPFQNRPGGVESNNGGFMQQPQQYTEGLSSHPTSEGLPNQPGSATSSSSQSPYSTSNPPCVQLDGGNSMAQQAHGVSQQVHGVPSHMPQRTQSGPVSTQGNNNNEGVQFNNGGFMQQPPQYTPGLSSQPTSEAFPNQPGSATSSNSQTPLSATPNAPGGQFDGGNFMTQQAHGGPSHTLQRAQSGPPNNVIGDMFAPAGVGSLGTSASQPSLTPLTGAIEIVPQTQIEKKFEPKSTIWADTLSRGLVNFNISGPKTNPLADIGVDFAAINRKEKRLEKPTAAQQQQQVTSTINMGKAMGSGTGLGRAGAGAMRPPPNSMAGSSMPMGMNVGGYGGMNQNHPMGMNQNHSMGMGMNVNQNYPMGMNMNQNYPMGMNQNQHPMGMGGMNMSMGGYGQGYPMQPQQGMQMGPGPQQGMHMGPQQGMQMGPGPQQGMNNGAYNPMMGQGGYNPQQQQPYGGGYR